MEAVCFDCSAVRAHHYAHSASRNRAVEIDEVFIVYYLDRDGGLDAPHVDLAHSALTRTHPQGPQQSGRAHQQPVRLQTGFLDELYITR
jgi:hypothetical protein